MRVIAGSLKGRRLKTPDWDGLRPTSDKLRETLFNILAPRIAGARVLDGFAGTGALGIEALSRGAAAVTFIEEDRARAGADSRPTWRSAGSTPAIISCAARSSAPSRRCRPPLSSPSTSSCWTRLTTMPGHTALMKIDALVAPGGLVVLEHAKRAAAPEQAGRLVRVREVKSGDSMLTFYEAR